MANASIAIPGIVATFARPSHGGIEFPATRWGIKGGIRYFLHEYLRVAGGQVEKLGRKAYLYNFVIPAYTELDFAPKPYTDFYPNTLTTILTQWESGATLPLSVPGRGVVPAVCVNWSSEFDAKIQCGEEVTVEFLEDSFDNTVGGLFSPAQSAESVTDAVLTLQAKAIDVNYDPDRQIRVVGPGGVGLAPGGSIIDDMVSIAQSIQAIQDQAQLTQYLILDRLATLLSYCQGLDRDPFLRDTRNADIFEAMMEAWYAAAKMQADVLSTGFALRTTRTGPKVSTIDQVAIDLYGSTDRVIDLLGLNRDLDDPYEIPPETRVLYYDDQALLAA